HGDVSPGFNNQTGCAFRPEGVCIPNVRDRYRSLGTVLGSYTVSRWLSSPVLFLGHALIDALWLSLCFGRHGRRWALLQCRRALRCYSRGTIFWWYCASRGPILLVRRRRRWRTLRRREGCYTRCASAGLAFLRAFRDPYGFGWHRGRWRLL